MRERSGDTPRPGRGRPSPAPLLTREKGNRRAHPHRRGRKARAGASRAWTRDGRAGPMRGMVGARVVQWGGVGPCGCPGPYVRAYGGVPRISLFSSLAAAGGENGRQKSAVPTQTSVPTTTIVPIVPKTVRERGETSRFSVRYIVICPVQLPVKGPSAATPTGVQKPVIASPR